MTCAIHVKSVLRAERQAIAMRLKELAAKMEARRDGLMHKHAPNLLRTLAADLEEERGELPADPTSPDDACAKARRPGKSPEV